MCPSISLRICDDLLCDTCEAKRISTLALERSQKEQTAPALSTPAALDGNPEVVNTVASEESEEPGDLQLEVPKSQRRKQSAALSRKHPQVLKRLIPALRTVVFPVG